MESSRNISSPFLGITNGSDDNIWFTNQTDDAVWRYTLSSGTFTEFPTPTPDSFQAILGDWLRREYVVHRTGSGQIRPHHTRRRDHRVQWSERSELHRRRARRYLWIAIAFTPQIARVTLAFDITIIIRPRNADNLLFTEFSANKIASITTDGVVTESPEFVGSAPVGITEAVASNRVLFLGVGTNRVYETVVPR